MVAVEVASDDEAVSGIGAWLWKATFLFFLPPPSIWSMQMDSKDIMAVRLLNISFTEGSSSPDVQFTRGQKGPQGETVFLTDLPFLADLVVAFFL